MRSGKRFCQEKHVAMLLLNLVPQRLPVLAFEVQRVNVMVFLRWILCVLYGSIRTLPEPFRMLLHVRVIRSALKRDIKSNFKSMICSLGYKMAKVFKSTQLWMNRRMAALLRSDRPWTTYII